MAAVAIPSITEPVVESRFSILIADDDAANRETLAGVLAESGFDTLTAADGKDAVRLFQNQPVHLALLDMHMPRMTGLQAIRVLRKINDSLPAVLMTANSSRDLVDEATRERVFRVIEKPVTKPLVLATLQQALMIAYPNLFTRGVSPR
jgi:two-component system, response regulator PdtaR